MEWQVFSAVAVMQKFRSNNNSRKFHSALTSTFLRYLFIGGVLYLVDFSVVLTLVHQLKVHPALAQFIGRSIGAGLGFFLHQRITFSIRGINAERHHSVRSRGVGYIALTVFAVAVSPGVLMVYMSIFDGYLPVAKVLTDGSMIVLTFIAMKNLFRSAKP